MLPLPFGGGFGVLGGKEYFCGGVGEGGERIRLFGISERLLLMVNHIF